MDARPSGNKTYRLMSPQPPEPPSLETPVILDQGVLRNLLRDAVDHIPGPPAFRVYLWHLLEQRLLSEAEQGGVDLLPILTYQACGRSETHGCSVTTAWQVVRLSAKMLDDIEDDQCDGAGRLLANAATALLPLAQVILQRASPQLAKAQNWQIVTSLQDALLRAAAGQHVDLALGTEPDCNSLSPASWLRVASAKTGSLVGWAAAAGAIAAGASRPAVAAHRAYGRHLGVLVQLADDFNDAWGADQRCDLTTGGLNLATSYAWWVGNATQVTLLRERLDAASAGDRSALSAARQILIEMGAQAYFVAVAELHRRKAIAAIHQAAPCSDTTAEVLRELVERVFPTPQARGPG